MSACRHGCIRGSQRMGEPSQDFGLRPRVGVPACPRCEFGGNQRLLVRRTNARVGRRSIYFQVHLCTLSANVQGFHERPATSAVLSTFCRTGRSSRTASPCPSPCRWSPCSVCACLRKFVDDAVDRGTADTPPPFNRLHRVVGVSLYAPQCVVASPRRDAVSSASGRHPSGTPQSARYRSLR